MATHPTRGTRDPRLAEREVRRLHLGCGPVTPPDWINVDVVDRPGVDICGDVLDGLPLDDGSVDYISSQHVLQELELYDQERALRELRRVLKPGGVLRLCLPDFELAIAAYRRGDREYFGVWSWDTVDGDFVEWMLWLRSYTRTLFTYPLAEELARKAGFSDVRRVAFRQTSSRFPDIVELDNRENESFYLEATKGAP
jgi:SAM-dependent methyltransferase